MIDCADSTRLRAHLDVPDAELDAHLDDCGTCTGLLRSVAADAGFARRALATLDPPVGAEPTGTDVQAALAAVLAGAPAAPVDPLASRTRRRSSFGRRLVLAGAAALVVLAGALTPTGRAAFADVLDAFRGERLQVVAVDLESWAASIDRDRLAVLEIIGEVDASGLAEPTEVADVAEAEAVAGIAAPVLTEVPDRLVALAPGTVRLVLVARDGNGVPADLDGAALVVDVPGGIAAVQGPADGPPELVVGRSGMLDVRAEGASLETVRSFLLGRDDLPADLRDQLAAFDDWRSTIPVPVPVDGPGWEEVEVAGRRAIALGDDTGIGAVVIREDPGGVTVVGGRIGISRALDLAAEA